ncbi:hypothetical protein DRQ20_03795 [bacterium]|nr:MAG: hypothetical protein DRQ20_03795 [bacterium]
MVLKFLKIGIKYAPDGNPRNYEENRKHGVFGLEALFKEIPSYAQSCPVSLFSGYHPFPSALHHIRPLMS